MTLAESLSNLESALRKPLIKRASIVALQRLKAEQAQRIFQDGEATDGSDISSRRKARNPRTGDYSRSHGNKRQRIGRRIDKVDLEFTGGLRRSLIVGTDSEGEVVYGFKDERNRKIGEGHTEHRQQEIFNASKKEIKLVEKTIVAEIRVAINKAVG